jgi:uncharacterized phage-associated protein
VKKMYSKGRRPGIHQEIKMAISEKLDAVQKAVIATHREIHNESPSPMKLQKLCYYAQGYWLVESGELFPEDFQAWQHGPVIPDLYQKYAEYQWRAIDVAIPPESLDPEVMQAVADIVTAYGRFDGAALSTMTHRESPWVDARGDLPESEGSNEIIPKGSLKKFFAEKLRAHGEAQ